MSRARSLVVWTLVTAQIWSPLMAQTLPIAVDGNAPGQRPFVGISGNGVPIVNIAPPSSSGVSNNAFTHFNVGPSGVVLNNSGGPSTSQLAGSVAGNPMLGHSQASTILNQVTANNPSQLRGLMEVAGGRANVIVANPAGITCDGCGFLNAHRGTFTTGRPIVGPDGGLQGFDVSRGRLSIEGQGLYGDNLSQTDLIARSLSINAAIWADKLNVVAGPGVVGYENGTVQPRSADEPAAFSLDLAALGGMYANSIRLVGTEAGVGVNIGGNLAALTGDLQLSAAGDLRIQPSATVQAAGRIDIRAGQAFSNAGTVLTNQALQAESGAAMWLGGTLYAAGGGLALKAGQDLTIASGGQALAKGDVRLDARGNVSVAGAVSSARNVAINAARSVALDGRLAAEGALAVNAADDIAGRSNGVLQAGETLHATAGNHIALDGTLWSERGIALRSGGDTRLRAPQVAALGDMSLSAGGVLRVGTPATAVAPGGGGDPMPSDPLPAVGNVATDPVTETTSVPVPALVSAGDGVASRPAIVRSRGPLSVTAGGDVTLTGAAHTDGEARLESGADLRIDGAVSAARGLALKSAHHIAFGDRAQVRAVDAVVLDARQDVTLAAGSDIESGARLSISAGRDGLIAGSVASMHDLTLAVARAAAIDGRLGSATRIALDAAGSLSVGRAAQLDSNGTIEVDAGRDVTLDGTVLANGHARVRSGGNLDIGGAISAASGRMDIEAGRQLAIAGSVMASGPVALASMGDSTIDGAVGSGTQLRIDAARDVRIGRSGRLDSNGALAIVAGQDLSLGGTTRASGNATLQAARDIDLAGAFGAAGRLDATAGRDLNTAATATVQSVAAASLLAGGNARLAGEVSSDASTSVRSLGNLQVDGALSAYGGDLSLTAGQDVKVATTGRAQAATNVTATTGQRFSAAGVVSAMRDLTVSARDVVVDGQVGAGGAVDVDAADDLILGAAAKVQADGALALKAGQDIAVAGTVSAGTALALDAQRRATIDGTLAAFGGGAHLAARDALTLRDGAHLQATHDIRLSGSDVAMNGTLSGASAVRIDAERDVTIGGELAATTALTIDAGHDIAITAAGHAQAGRTLVATAGRNVSVAGVLGTAGDPAHAGELRVTAGEDVHIAGTVTANSPLALQAARDIRIDGTATATGGNLNAQAARDIKVGEKGRAQSAGDVDARAGRSVDLSGILAANHAVRLHADGDARVQGTVAALAGDATLSTLGNVEIGTTARVQAEKNLVVDAGGNLSLAGALSAVDDATLRAGQTLHIAGTAAAGGQLGAHARDVSIAGAGVVQAGAALDIVALDRLTSAGALLGERAAFLIAGNTLTLSGTTAALSGALKLEAQRGNVVLEAASRAQAQGDLGIRAAGVLQALGTASSAKAVSAQAQDIILSGLMAALGGDLRLDATENLVVTDSGRAQASGNLVASANGNIGNAGVMSAAHAAQLIAGRHLTNTGTLLAAGDVWASAGDRLDNGGRMLAGFDAAGTPSLPGSVTLDAKGVFNRGTVAAGKDVSVRASTIDTASGAMSALGNLGLTATGDIDSRSATLFGQQVDVRAANLDNQRGKISAGNTLAVAVDGLLDNRYGILAADAAATLSGRHIFNQSGAIGGRDVTVSAGDTLANTAGLIQADNSLIVRAATLLNGDTIASGATQALGIVGKQVQIDVASIDNTRGTIAAVDALTIATTQLQNTAGLISAGTTADIHAQDIYNDQGVLSAGQRLAVNTHTLAGDGTLQSQNDLSLTINGDWTHTGRLVAGRDLALNITGDFANDKVLAAGGSLLVTARNVTNAAGGELASSGTTAVQASQALLNDGLIDGSTTALRANHLHNTGRIYGDHVAIAAETLINDVGTHGAAVIASRGDIDIGAAAINNRDHALIYSTGNLRIGRVLDGMLQAAGQSQAVWNESATIEAGGNLDIAAETLLNANKHFATENITVAQRPHVYYRLNGSTDMLDGDHIWLCLKSNANCSQDPSFLGDSRARGILLPSTRYPTARFGPPFDYSKNIGTWERVDTPIGLSYHAASENCSGGDNGSCSPTPERFTYAADAPIWSVFGISPPDEVPPAPVAGKCGTYAACQAQQKQHDDAHAAKVSVYKALDAQIREFNNDFADRLVYSFTFYEVNETVSETRTTSSDPARIIAGGNATLIGKVVNDKSQIIAGGTLAVSGPAIENIGAVGERRVEGTGRMTYTAPSGGTKRDFKSEAYSAVVSSSPIELAVASAVGGAAGGSGASAPGAGNVSVALQPATITNVGVPGGGIVRTVTPPSTVPNNALYAVLNAADAPYLVATDERFTGQRPFVSSDYLLDLLRGWDPRDAQGSGSGSTPGGVAPTTQQAAVHVDAQSGIPGSNAAWNGAAPAGAGGFAKGASLQSQPTQTKRLGDGFYEQRIVADQIMTATGQRFLDEYTDNESQYIALLTSGADFAKQHQIQVGVALSPEQVQQLTTDLVWLVEQTVTLPDGITQNVLVPQVYLVVRDGDLTGDGTLMAGRDVTLNTTGNITNSGTIAAREATVMTAQNIANQAGATIQGTTVNLLAREDLTNLAALIKGDTVALQAGRDVNLITATDSFQHGATWGTFVSGISQIHAKDLAIDAGRDLTARGALLTADNSAYLQAGRDINLQTVGESHGEAATWKKKNSTAVNTSSEVGTTITSGGRLAMVAGQDIVARGVNASADGDLALIADRDVRIDAAQNTGYARDEHYRKQKGFLSSKSTHTIDESTYKESVASMLSGDNVLVSAGRDIQVTGSNIVGDRDVQLDAGRDVLIAAAQNYADDYQYKKVKKSGFGGVGVGIGYNTQQRTDWLDSDAVTYSASTVGSIGGDLAVSAGRDVRVVGSDLLAQDGSILLQGRDVLIEAALGRATQHEFHEVKQSGIAIGLSGGVVDAAVQAKHQLDAASEAQDGRLAAVKVGQAAYTAYQANNLIDAATASDATQQDKANSEVQIKVSIGSSKSVSESKRAQESVAGSSVTAGGNVTIIARGAPGEENTGNIGIIGSDIAGRNVTLAAANDILLLGKAQQSTDDSKSKNSGWNAGVGFGTSQGGGGMTVSASGYAGSGQTSGNGTTHRETQVTASNNLTLTSGRDTALIGAQARGDTIYADVGRDLTLISQQDIDRYHAKDKQITGGGSFSFGSMTGSAYAGVSKGKVDSDYLSVVEQTGLFAGKGGFDIDVGGHTQLTGAVIASLADASKNSLSTDTFGFSNLTNRADYTASAAGMGAGLGGEFKDTTQFGGGPAGVSVAQTSGSASGLTQSAISAGTIIVRSDDSLASLDGLSRTPDSANGSINKIFDADKVRETIALQQAVIALAQDIGGDLLKSRAQELDALEKQSKNPNLSSAERQQAATDFAALNADWGPQGNARRWTTAVLGAVSGNLAGGALQLVQSATVNYLQALGAEKIKAISAELGGEGSPGHVALHAVLGCAGGAAQGGSCGAGAAGASASVVLNALFDRLGDTGAELSAKEREDRIGLITTIVAGVASAVDSGSAVTAATAARIEAENNAMAGLMNRREVAPVAAMMIEEVELGCLSAGDMNRCLTEGWQQVDQVVSAYDRAVTMQHYPAMTTQRAREVAQTAVDLAPFVSNASSLYELMNGSSPVSGDEANRWLAALGVVPVFGGMIRGAGKSLLEIARAAKAKRAVKGRKR